MLCRLKQLGTALSEASSLAELRASYNQLTGLPRSLAKNVRLKIVEVGNNPISDFDDIKVGSVILSTLEFTDGSFVLKHVTCE